MEDASDDLLLVEDESAPIPFVVGEVFVHFNMEETKVLPHTWCGASVKQFAVSRSALSIPTLLIIDLLGET